MSFGFLKWFQRKQTDGDKKKKKVNKQGKAQPVIRVHQYEEVDLPKDRLPPRRHSYEDLDLSNKQTKTSRVTDYMSPVNRMHNYEDVDLPPSSTDNNNRSDSHTPVIYDNIQPDTGPAQNGGNGTAACLYENTENIIQSGARKTEPESLNYIEVDFIKREPMPNEGDSRPRTQPPNHTRGSAPRTFQPRLTTHEPIEYTTIEDARN